MAERRQLALASDERRGDRTGERRHVFPQAGDPPGRDRLGLTGERERLERLGFDGVGNESVRFCADQDLSSGRGLLEPGRDVDGVARRQLLCGCRVAGDHLAGVHSGARLDAESMVALEVLVEQGERRVHLDGCPDRAQRVVLVQRRESEHRHDRVADELLHGPAVVFDRRLHRVEVAGHHAPDRLRIEPVAESGRADEIGEDDRDDLADLRRVRRRAERGSARAAEASVVGVLVAAVGARVHRRSVRPYACRVEPGADGRRPRARNGQGPDPGTPTSRIPRCP